MMSIGIFQILIIVLLVVLLFGAGRVPRMMEDLGKGIRSFRKGLDDGKEPAAGSGAIEPPGDSDREQS